MVDGPASCVLLLPKAETLSRISIQSRGRGMKKMHASMMSQEGTSVFLPFMILHLYIVVHYVTHGFGSEFLNRAGVQMKDPTNHPADMLLQTFG